MRGDDELLRTRGSSDAGDPFGACGSKLQRSGPQGAYRLASSILPRRSHPSSCISPISMDGVRARRRGSPAAAGTSRQRATPWIRPFRREGRRGDMPWRWDECATPGFCAAVFFRRSVPWKSDTSQVGLSLLSILHMRCAGHRRDISSLLSRFCLTCSVCDVCVLTDVWQFLNYKSQFMHFLEG
ncbi:hypothetical protein VPH35_008741 [Triticum aestivum]